MASFSIAKEALKNSPYVAYVLLEVEKFILLPDSSPTPTVTSSSITATTTVSSIDTTVSVRMHDEVMFNSRERSLTLATDSDALHHRADSEQRDGIRRQDPTTETAARL
jgi:hypothetical protein